MHYNANGFVREFHDWQAIPYLQRKSWRQESALSRRPAVDLYVLFPTLITHDCHRPRRRAIQYSPERPVFTGCSAFAEHDTESDRSVFLTGGTRYLFLVRAEGILFYLP
jgi:hypothetical protein